MALYYRTSASGGVGRVPATVFAVGWDEHHLIVQRRPENNRRIMEYYIVERAKDSALAEPREAVIGPLSDAEFRIRRQEVGVAPTLDFSYRTGQQE